MAVEHHDRFRPGARKLIDQALAQRNYEIAERGENTWYRAR
jgi:hypothetical protein